MKFPITKERLQKAGIKPEVIAVPYPDEGIALSNFCELALTGDLKPRVLDRIADFLADDTDLLPTDIHHWVALKLCIEVLPLIEAAYPDARHPAGLLQAAENFLSEPHSSQEFEQAFHAFEAWRKERPEWDNTQDLDTYTRFSTANHGLNALNFLPELRSGEPFELLSWVSREIEYGQMHRYAGETGRRGDGEEKRGNL